MDLDTLKKRVTSGYYTEQAPMPDVGPKPMPPGAAGLAKHQTPTVSTPDFEAYQVAQATYKAARTAARVERAKATAAQQEARRAEFDVDLVAALDLTGHPKVSDLLEVARCLAGDFEIDQGDDYGMASHAFNSGDGPSPDDNLELMIEMAQRVAVLLG
jgi:hypothetical protein